MIGKVDGASIIPYHVVHEFLIIFVMCRKPMISSKPLVLPVAKLVMLTANNIIILHAAGREGRWCKQELAALYTIFCVDLVCIAAVSLNCMPECGTPTAREELA